jgi:hypothetical protein
MRRYGAGAERVGVVLALSLAFLGCDDKKQPAPSAAPAPSTAASASAATTLGANAPSPQKIDASVLEQLPAVDEAFHAAKGLGLLDAWQTVAPLKPRKFEGLKPGEASILAGETLVDVAVAAADDKKPVPPALMEQARAAVKVLNPPEDTMKKIDVFTTSAKKDADDPKAQRREINTFISTSLGAIQGDDAAKSDPILASRVNLAMLGGYLRSLGVTSKLVATLPAPDADKLRLLCRSQEEAYFTNLLQNSLDPSFRGEPAVQHAVDALKKIAPSVAKPDPTIDDAKLIAAALAEYV